MKRLLILCLLLPAMLFSSCSKNINEDEAANIVAGKLSIIPPPTLCPAGSYKDPFTGKCVTRCPPGYFPDPLTRSCLFLDTRIHWAKEDMFKGIFFFQGLAAGEIPYYNSIRQQIQSLPAADQQAFSDYSDELMGIINTLNPGYLTELQTKINASNPDTIMDVMDKGAGLVLSAVAISSQSQNYTNAVNTYALMDTSRYDFTTVDGVNTFLKDYGNRALNSNSVTIPDKGLCVFFAAVVAVAIWDAVAAVNYGVVVNAAAIAVVYAAVYAKVVFWPRKDVLPVRWGRLDREQLVLDVTEHLSDSTGYTGGGGGGLIVK